MDVVTLKPTFVSQVTQCAADRGPRKQASQTWLAELTLGRQQGAGSQQLQQVIVALRPSVDTHWSARRVEQRGFTRSFHHCLPVLCENRRLASVCDASWETRHENRTARQAIREACLNYRSRYRRLHARWRDRSGRCSEHRPKPLRLCCSDS